jgi:hypothetical protein
VLQCADITLTDAAVRFAPCSNATGISAEPVAEEDHSGHEEGSATETANPDNSTASGTSSPTADPEESEDAGSGAAVIEAAGSMVLAGVVAAGAFLL